MSATSGVIKDILELARRAPSGDNTQPWRFEIIDDLWVVVHGFDTRNHCVYDLDGHPSQISLGALLETMCVAATAHGLAMQAARRPNCPESKPTIDVRFSPDADLKRDPLFESIAARSVQRRAMRMRRLTVSERVSLDSAVGPDYRLLWLEDLRARLRTTRLLFDYAKLRLTMPEAYLVHREVIRWGARYSEDGVPDQALGIDPLTLHLMRFVMREWSRVKFFNTFFGGTWMPRMQMELIPGIACAAHFILSARDEPTTIDHYIQAGRTVQRFWLTATQLGLTIQPELTPLIFSRYVREGIRFSSDAPSCELSSKLFAKFKTFLGGRNSVFMGRIGACGAPRARSTRLSVERLLRPSCCTESPSQRE